MQCSPQQFDAKPRTECPKRKKNTEKDTHILGWHLRQGTEALPLPATPFLRILVYNENHHENRPAPSFTFNLGIKACTCYDNHSHVLGRALSTDQKKAKVFNILELPTRNHSTSTTTSCVLETLSQSDMPLRQHLYIPSLLRDLLPQVTRTLSVFPPSPSQTRRGARPHSRPSSPTTNFPRLSDRGHRMVFAT